MNYFQVSQCMDQLQGKVLLSLKKMKNIAFTHFIQRQSIKEIAFVNSFLTFLCFLI